MVNNPIKKALSPLWHFMNKWRLIILLSFIRIHLNCTDINFSQYFNTFFTYLLLRYLYERVKFSKWWITLHNGVSMLLHFQFWFFHQTGNTDYTKGGHAISALVPTIPYHQKRKNSFNATNVKNRVFRRSNPSCESVGECKWKYVTCGNQVN